MEERTVVLIVAVDVLESLLLLELVGAAAALLVVSMAVVV